MQTHKLTRFSHFIWRFQALRRAKRAFANVDGPLLMNRSFAGRQLVLDVSRSSRQQMVFLEGERAIPERFLIARLLHPGMRVVDVGANIGYYLLLLEHAVGPQGEVICIEPSPENHVELEANIARNKFNNVQLYKCAVGASDGRTGLRTGINSGIVPLELGAYSTAMRTLNSLVEGPVDFLKIDVDGYEGQVLDGSLALIDRDRPILFLEFHPMLVGRFGCNFKTVYDLLRRFYDRIEFFDVPEPVSLAKKVAIRYFNKDATRQVDVRDIAEEKLHLGRQHGMFWVVCR